jgi:tetratricopeptide (TPR) repeat protein
MQTAQFFTDGSGARSIEILQNGRDKVSDDQRIELRRNLGFALNYAGRYEEAAIEFREILAEQSNDPDALWGLGNALAGLKRYDEADSAFGEAVKKRSGVVGLRLDYAQAMLAAKRNDIAGEQVVEASLLAPKDGDVLTFLGWIAATGGDWEAAKINYTAALEADPDYRLASVLLITAEKKLGNKNEAARLLKQAQAQMKSDSPEWHYVTRISDYEARKVWPHDLKELLADAAK